MAVAGDLMNRQPIPPSVCFPMRLTPITCQPLRVLLVQTLATKDISTNSRLSRTKCTKRQLKTFFQDVQPTRPKSLLIHEPHIIGEYWRESDGFSKSWWPNRLVDTGTRQKRCQLAIKQQVSNELTPQKKCVHLSDHTGVGGNWFCEWLRFGQRSFGHKGQGTTSKCTICRTIARLPRWRVRQKNGFARFWSAMQRNRIRISERPRILYKTSKRARWLKLSCPSV